MDEAKINTDLIPGDGTKVEIKNKDREIAAKTIAEVTNNQFSLQKDGSDATKEAMEAVRYARNIWPQSDHHERENHPLTPVFEEKMIRQRDVDDKTIKLSMEILKKDRTLDGDDIAILNEEFGFIKDEKKQPLIDTLVRKAWSPERAVELLSAQIMMGIEIAHDMQLYPAKYGFDPNQVGTGLVPQEPPAAKWAFDNIGDIWEISAGFTAMRLGFVAVNEALKKTTGKEISDDAVFWASLTSIVTIKAVHSLGYISLFGIHAHMDAPVPGMLFGQAVAAVVLAASHYAAKHREPIKKLAERAGLSVIKVAKSVDRKLDQVTKKIKSTGRPDVVANTALNVDDKKKE